MGLRAERNKFGYGKQCDSDQTDDKGGGGCSDLLQHLQRIDKHFFPNGKHFLEYDLFLYYGK